MLPSWQARARQRALLRARSRWATPQREKCGELGEVCPSASFWHAGCMLSDVMAADDQAGFHWGPQGPDDAMGRGESSARGGGRMNLLLSHAGWEDEAWVDRLPRLLAPMGVVSHRAGSGEEASRVIRSLEIHLAIVDLALPLAEPESETPRAPELAEGGTRLLELLARLPAPPPMVAVARHRTSRGDARDMSEALRWGAFAVVNRPQRLADVELVLDVLKRCLERHYRGRWPGRGTKE